jgi:excisionase family DNA binding protein
MLGCFRIGCQEEGLRMESQHEQPAALRVEDVARALGVSRGTVQALIRRGALQSLKIGRVRRISREELDRFLREGGAAAGRTE